MSINCPLCSLPRTFLWHTEVRKPLVGREYWRCLECDLIFVPEVFHLAAEQEKNIYLQHDNNPADPGYRRFLQTLQDPLLPWLKECQSLLGRRLDGLDFGSGPGPTLALMLQEAGFSCQNYDPYFAPEPERLETTYDFIVSTEVFEHLAKPGQTMKQLLACLKTGGLLGIMTQRPRDKAAFQKWHYVMDPTHLAFYSDACFAWIARRWSLETRCLGRSVVIFQLSQG